jgi:hypothetical protein
VEVVIERVLFSHINFVENTVYGSLHQDKLIQQITMQDNPLNNKHQNYKFGLKLLSPWKDGEEKLRGLNAIIRYDIDINNFRDYAENNLWQG